MSEQPDRMDIHEFRNSRRRKTDNLLKEDHRDLKRFFALDSACYRDATDTGGLDAKTKELLGLVASTVLRCNDCIAYHCDQCVEVGWKKSELLDALNVALVVGGSITIPHIRTVWEVVEQLYEERELEARGPQQAAALAGVEKEVKTGKIEEHRSHAHATLGLTGTALATAKPPAAAKGAPSPTATTPKPTTTNATATTSKPATPSATATTSKPTTPSAAAITAKATPAATATASATATTPKTTTPKSGATTPTTAPPTKATPVPPAPRTAPATAATKSPPAAAPARPAQPTPKASVGAPSDPSPLPGPASSGAKKPRAKPATKPGSE